MSKRKRDEGVEESNSGLQILPDTSSETVSKTYVKTPVDFVSIYDIQDVWLLDKARYIVRKHLNQVENYAQYIADKLTNRGIHIEFNGHITPNPYGFTLIITFNIGGIRRDLLANYLRPFKEYIRERTDTEYKYKRVDRILGNTGDEEDEDLSDIEVDIDGGTTNSSNPAPDSKKAQGEGG